LLPYLSQHASPELAAMLLTIVHIVMQAHCNVNITLGNIRNFRRRNHHNIQPTGMSSYFKISHVPYLTQINFFITREFELDSQGSELQFQYEVFTDFQHPSWTFTDCKHHNYNIIY
jgi:hypothetical protein